MAAAPAAGTFARIKADGSLELNDPKKYIDTVKEIDGVMYSFHTINAKESTLRANGFLPYEELHEDVDEPREPEITITSEKITRKFFDVVTDEPPEEELIGDELQD